LSGEGKHYRIKANGDQEYVNYIYAGNRPIGTYTTRTLASGAAGATDLRYFHLDGQGSIIAITNEVGAVVERLSYDAWGKRRNANGTDDLTNALVSAITDHGYTGHEHLDDMGLIHMNGRVYDPRTGRFLQADPTIQSPGNLQSFNRYTYVMNNPFFYTDPSGFSWLGDRWKAATGTNWADSRDQYVKPLVAIAIAVYAPQFIGNFGAGFASGLVSSGGDLKAALVGGFTAGAFGGLHGMDFGFEKVLMHGMVGGISSVANGGKFGAGFLSAGFTQFASGMGAFNSLQDPLSRAQNATMAAVIGGTASVLGGGKFANGAVTGAFSRLFNDLRVENTSQVKGLHQKITVDTPKGPYSVSFGMDSRDSPMQGASEAYNVNPTSGGEGSGVVYEDTDSPTAVANELRTSPAEDAMAQKYLSSLVGERGPYNVLTNSCRTFSDNQFDRLKSTIISGRK
jgi:RHS repeat-associated protein